MHKHPLIDLKPADRKALFEATERAIGLSPVMAEKDFWVCWALDQLFSLPNAQEHFIFKGGTSLSKVWRVIERFSEDIDIVISREWLGFVGSRDPETAASGKQRKKRLEELADACAEKLRTDILPSLCENASAAMGDGYWKAEIDTDDPQTILFTYPSVFDHSASYLRRVVKIECGARGDTWPTHDGQVIPYVDEAFPEQLPNSPVRVSALGIERTFWEKALILHVEAHKEAADKTAPRYSRHYSDLAALAAHEAAQDALQKADLRKRVIAHTQTFFRRSGDAYATANPGTFRLVPSAERLAVLADDYKAMNAMFFRPPLPWSDVIVILSDLEKRINNLATGEGS